MESSDSKMDSSALITCIDSALNDVGFLMNGADRSTAEYFMGLRYRLRNLKIFLLPATMLDDGDASLGSLFLRIEQVVRQNAEKIHPHCLDFTGPATDLHFSMAFEFRMDIKSLEEEMDGWYQNMFDETRELSLSLTTDDVLKIISSLMENLADFEYFKWTVFQFEKYKEATQTMGEQMTFLKNLICYATHDSSVLLAHAQAAAVYAAYLLFICRALDGVDEESHERIQYLISTFTEKMKPTDPEVYEIYTKALNSSKLQSHMDDDDDDAFIAVKNLLQSLISNLWEVLQLNTPSVVSNKDQLQLLYEGLRSLGRTILKQQSDKFEMKIVQDIRTVVSDVGISIFSFYQEDTEAGLGLQDLSEKIKIILAEVGEKDPQVPTEVERKTIEVKKVTKSYEPPAQRIPSITNEVVGFKNDTVSVIDRLRRGSNPLRIVAIVGMPGSGKTTLATKVYNDSSISHHFHVRAWCSISQVLNKKNVLLDLVNQIDPNNSKCFEMSEQELVEKLWHSLKRRRYLIFLDDIWDIKAWDELKETFPDDSVGSRIILTSRHHDAAPHDLLDQEPHVLDPLNEEESLELLQSKLFPRNDCPPVMLRDLGMQIAKNCKGLPLTIVIVAGILATREPESWNEILDDLSSGIVSSTEQCRNVFELSYKHLPDDLRPCLLYFGAFQEDEEISVRRLLRLWIAEGFVQKPKTTKSREDAAESYLEDLIGRSLIMVVKNRCDGGVKTCRIHDLLHDFCLQKGRDENFFHMLKGHDDDGALEFNSQYVRRLCIQSESPDHFRQLKLFFPQARSLLFNFSQGIQKLWSISYIFQIFKLLRVLDLEQIHLSSGFPTEVELLVQLAFLAIRGEIRQIPSSIAKLSNLETFIVDPVEGILSLPDSLWSLQKLKYLYIRSTLIYIALSGGTLPIQNLESSSFLYELDRLSGVIIPSWDTMERLLRKFPNLRKLKCQLFQFSDNPRDLDEIVVPDFLSRLESLHMSCSYHRLPGSTMFCFPDHLKKLTLSHFFLSCKNMSTIGALSNLEILKLLGASFEGDTWEMQEGEFLNLRILKLATWNLVKWRGCDDQFECLQKLRLYQCSHLEEIPSCLEYCPSLEMIEVIRCSNTIHERARQIQEEQVNLGNPGMKINEIILQSYSQS